MFKKNDMNTVPSPVDASSYSSENETKTITKNFFAEARKKYPDFKTPSEIEQETEKELDRPLKPISFDEEEKRRNTKKILEQLNMQLKHLQETNDF